MAGASDRARPRRVEHKMGDKGLIPLYATGTVEQPYDDYTSVDHQVWGRLYRRQIEVLARRMVPEHALGLTALEIGADAIPHMGAVSERLRKRSGFSLVGVEGLLPDEVFFSYLARREFPVTWWMRTPAQEDYVSEPDLFHDMFGHVPLLMQPAYADFAQAFGVLGAEAHARGDAADVDRLGRLYWFTLEFGLVRTAAGLRILGAGIASSRDESIRATDDPAIARVAFDKALVERTPFRIDQVQAQYFVLDGLDALSGVLSLPSRPSASHKVGAPLRSAGLG